MAYITFTDGVKGEISIASSELMILLSQERWNSNI